ncbi:Vegetative incompatibility protein HET-E-like protein [Hapsidospora chrysogenum ATCC 11550]|uniref:Vegetative incompatibility protein HET-E-like protein n=1 Tax=Hapsidospora chrysogenum (strain ATCC 11550 / CBS 779.69 / DSM 880 / IAM 14645 / JCM 23072 / IMI 49137) TaxID=857340 RepID=A0A086T644_HAPC1|nr:Vegetative incompatibility protein HET-E-like protein [Hapsidospora chrysogenum ATCC 11550]
MYSSPVDRNHSEIVKFKPNDHYYRIVRRTIEGMVRNMEGFQERRSVKAAKRSEARQWLNALVSSDPSDDKTRIENNKGGLLKDSYNWVLDHRRFKAWLDDDQVRLLRIIGAAGMGKTMLLCGIIDHLRELSKERRFVSYYFFRGDISSTRNATAALRGLAYLIVHRQPALISHLRDKLHVPNSSRFDDWEAMSKILRGILRDPSLPPVYLVVDALDECETGVAKLLDFVKETSTAENSRVKWLVSGRPDDTVEDALATGIRCPSHSLEITPELVSEAADNYTRHKVSELRIIQHNPTLKIEVYEKLRKNAGGTFLWAALVLEELYRLEFAEDEEIKEVIEKMPASVEALYKSMVDRVGTRSNGRFSQRCFRILSATVAAYRPLHLLELRTLAGLKNTLGLDQLKRLALLCGSFLVIRDHYVHIIHHSAKEYLATHVAAKAFPGGLHHQLFVQSLDGMSDILHQNIYGLESPGSSIKDVAPPDPDPLAPIRYCCVFWYQHLRDAMVADSKDRTELSDKGPVFSFLKTHVLYWLESLCLLGRFSDAMDVVRQLRGAVQNRGGHDADELLKLLLDAEKFMTWFGGIIEQAPLQIYGAGLVYSPDNSDVKQRFWGQRLLAIKNATAIGFEKNFFIRTLDCRKFGSIRAISFSPNGQLLATVTEDRIVRLWYLATGKCTHTLPHGDPVSAISFSPDSQLLATCSGKAVTVWDTAANSRRHTLEGHMQGVRSINFSPDGRLLGSASDDGKICLWNPARGSLTCKLVGHVFAFSPDGEFVATAAGPCVALWSATTGAYSHGADHGSDVSSIAFSPDSKVLAIAFGMWKDRFVRLWDVARGTDKETYHVPFDDDKWSGEFAGNVEKITFSADGKYIGISPSSTFKIINVADSICHRFGEGLRNPLTSLAFSPDSKLVVGRAKDGTMKLYHISSGETVLQSQSNPFLIRPDTVLLSGNTDIAYSPNSKLLAVALSGPEVVLLDATPASSPSSGDVVTGPQGRLLPTVGLIGEMTLSADGSLLVTRSLAETSIWDTATGAHRLTTRSDDRGFGRVFPTFSPDNKMLAGYSGLDKTLTICSIDADTQNHVGDGYGSLPVVDSDDNLSNKLVQGVSVVPKPFDWIATPNAGFRSMGLQFAPIEAFCFSNDSRRLALATEMELVLYDVVGRRFTHKRSFHPSLSIRHIILSPRRESLLVVSFDDGTLYLLDFETDCHKKILDFSPTVMSVAISPDGKTIASSQSHGPVRLWDMGNGTHRETILDTAFLEQDLCWLRFSDDGRSVETSLGCFPLSSAISSETGSPGGERPDGAIVVAGDWLVRDGSKVLWIPPNYGFRDGVFRRNVVVLRHDNGRATLINFRPRETT